MAVMVYGIGLVLLATGSIQGTLVDQNGTPVKGGTVYSQMYAKGAIHESNTTVDGDGHFKISVLQIWNDGSSKRVIFAKSVDGHVLAAVETDDVNQFRLVPTSSTPVQVVNSDGSPVLAAKVTFNDGRYSFNGSESSIYFPAAVDPGWSGYTDANGRCNLPVPANSRGHFSVTKTGYAKEDGDYPADAGGLPKATLYRSAMARGRVLSPSGQGLAGISLAIYSERGYSQFCKTDGNGGYVADSLEPGMYSIRAEMGVPKTLVVRTRHNTYLTEGKEIDGVDLRAEPGIKLTGQIVTMEDGKPFAKASVSLDTSDGTQVGDVETGSDGRFEAYVPSGNVGVRVWDTPAGRVDGNLYQCSETVGEKAATPVKIRVPAAFERPRQTRVAGIVVDTSGKPVSEANVDIIDFQSFGIRHVRSDANGHFLYNSQVGTKATCRASKGDAATAKEVSASGSELINLTLVDHSAGKIEAHCVCDDGNLPPDLHFELTLWEGNSDMRVATAAADASGSCAFDHVPAGKYSVSVINDGYQTKNAPQTLLSAGETKSCTVQVEAKNATLSGQILDNKGKAVENISIGTANDGQNQTLTDREGKFTLAHVTKGTTVITVDIDGNRMGFQLPKDGILRLPDMQRSTAAAGTQSHPFEQFIGLKGKEITASRWINSGPLRLADLKGRIVVLDFWAIWCVPCCEALPSVEKLSKEFPATDVTVIGIHVPGTPDARIDNFMKTSVITYPIAIDKADKNFGATSDGYPLNGIPTVIVIGRDGKIAYAGNEIDEATDVVRKLTAKN